MPRLDLETIPQTNATGYPPEHAAPVAGRYSTVTTSLNDPNQPNLAVTGPLKQDILMILGQNQVYVWVEEQLKLPICVVQKAPYKLRIEPPPAPRVPDFTSRMYETVTSNGSSGPSDTSICPR